MGIPLIGRIVQANGGKFALIDSNDVLGGCYQANTLEERNNIPKERRKVNMLCMVNGVLYFLNGGIENTNWERFTTGGTGGGSLDYDDVFYTGTIAPLNAEVLWFDDDSELSEISYENEVIFELKAVIKLQNERILKLEEQVEYILLNLPSSDNPTPTTGDYILLENGSKILLENGSYLILE